MATRGSGLGIIAPILDCPGFWSKREKLIMPECGPSCRCEVEEARRNEMGR